MSAALIAIAEALRSNGKHVVERGDQLAAQCPAHDDSNPSLSIKQRRDGTGVVVYCHAGCDHRDILGAIGLTDRDLFDEPRIRAAYNPSRTYTYTDGRKVHRKPGKKFAQSGNTSGRALYGVDNIGAHGTVYAVEGEKDVEAARAVGAVAVCGAMGAGKAHKFDWTPLRDHPVVIVADRDEPGRRHAYQVAEQLQGIAASVRIVEARAGKDLADHIAAGLGLDDLVAVEEARNGLPVGDSGQAHGIRDAEQAKHSGQVRMAYLLAAAYENKLLHVHGIGWHQWDGRRWAADDTGAAHRAVLDVLRRALAESLGDRELRADVRKCESAAGLAGVLEIAAALTVFAATVRDLDADPYLLNTANGTLDLRTQELRPHNPADRITKVCRGAYHPEAAQPAVWEAFLARVLPDGAVRGFVQRLAGLALLGEVREHILPIFTGTGRNGKGTLYKALLYALDDYGHVAEPDLFMHREGAHPTGQMDLLGRRLIVVSESDRDRRLAEATMKRLTGGDPVTARHMRRNFVTFTPSHLPILVTNHLPKVSGDDPAVWARIRVVPFAVCIPSHDQDTELDTKLHCEADGILSWAVAGLADYLAWGLDEPEQVRTATDDYQSESDAARRFIAEECVTTSPALKATTAQLHEAFERWRVRDGAEAMSQRAFGSALDRLGYQAGRPTNGKRWRTGIAVKVSDDEGE